jgi:single-strand DNA-binding protein
MRALRVHGPGFAVADSELRYIGDKNTPLCNVTLAFNRSFKRNDSWEKETSFVKCAGWGKTAENMNNMIQKGTLVYIDGYMKQENWTTKEGQKRTMLSVVIDNFNICEKFTKSDDKKVTVPSENNASENTDSDEIPF